jgi:hypothetical protein
MLKTGRRKSRKIKPGYHGFTATQFYFDRKIRKRGFAFDLMRSLLGFTSEFWDQPRSLVVRVSDYWSWGSGFDSRFYMGIFLEGEDSHGNHGLGS